MDSTTNCRPRFSIVYVILGLLVIVLLQELVLGPMAAKEEEVPYSRFRQDLEQGLVTDVIVEPERILYSVGDPASGTEAEAEGEEETYKAVRIEDEDLVEELLDAGVTFEAKTPNPVCSSPCLGGSCHSSRWPCCGGSS